MLLHCLSTCWCPQKSVEIFRITYFVLLLVLFGVLFNPSHLNRGPCAGGLWPFLSPVWWPLVPDLCPFQLSHFMSPFFLVCVCVFYQNMNWNVLYMLLDECTFSSLVNATDYWPSNRVRMAGSEYQARKNLSDSRYSEGKERTCFVHEVCVVEGLRVLVMSSGWRWNFENYFCIVHRDLSAYLHSGTRAAGIMWLSTLACFSKLCG